MKKIKLITFLIITNFINAQDGSDISYVDVNKIDSSLIGKYIQVDFYNKFKTDTINLKFKEFVKFKEIRNNDGFNNWFSQQYLESINTKNGLKMRIQKMKLLDVSKESIKVKLFGHHYINEQEVFSRYKTEIKTINRKDIIQILVHIRPIIGKGLSIHKVYENFPD